MNYGDHEHTETKYIIITQNLSNDLKLFENNKKSKNDLFLSKKKLNWVSVLKLGIWSFPNFTISNIYISNWYLIVMCTPKCVCKSLSRDLQIL